MANNSNVNKTNTGKAAAGTSAPASSGKKRHRRLKKSVRKTLGALFLVSALVVAAIPTEGLQAAVKDGYEEDTSVSVSEPVFEEETKTYRIPKVVDTATIYSYPLEGKGITFRFAYVTISGTEDSNDRESRYAVILGYEQTGNLEGGILEIPETMEAYKKYSMEGSTTGNVAVNLNDEFLYYMRTETKLDANGDPVQATEKLADGTVVPVWRDEAQTIPVYETEDKYYPCYYSTRSVWTKNTKETFYVADSKSDTGYSVSLVDRIASAQVSFIGNQYLKTETDKDSKRYGEWVVAGTVKKQEQGVFYGATNITTLVLPDSITGIGRYAFAGCGFATVKFGNGLSCLGDHAFYGCGSMTTVNFDVSCGVKTLGAYSFANCVALPELDLPGNVEQIGDHAFEGCTSLQRINFVYPDYVNAKGEKAPLYGRLTQLGRSVFRNCVSLKGIEFPNSYTKAVDVSEFQGCTSLEYIRSGFDDTMPTGSGSLTFTLKEGDYTGFGWKDFENQMPKNAAGTDTKFYLWGPKEGELHDLATAAEVPKTKTDKAPIAFKFYDTTLEPNMHVYEKVVQELDEEGKPLQPKENHQAVYWVNESNELMRCTIGSEIENLVLPESIGPKNINAIGAETFRNKCNLKTVTIPASVQTIADNAFKGCHHLNTVIFTNAESIAPGNIGKGAFNTQDFSGAHMTGCDQKTQRWDLLFVGAISNKSGPFLYAMEDPSKIDLGSVNRTYITYSSGFPTHLMVRRNETTGTNELIDYPTLNDMLNNKYNAKDYAYISASDEKQISEAAASYAQNGSLQALSAYQQNIIKSMLNLVLPEGIETIAMVDKDTGEPVDDPPMGTLVADENMISLGETNSSVIGLFSYKENNVDKRLLGRSADPSISDSKRVTDNIGCGNMRKTLEAADVRSIAPGEFRDCAAFQSVNLKGSLDAIGHYAFAGCTNLDNVSVSESVTALGRVPFIRCTSLSDVNFNGSERYSCKDSVIYKADENGELSNLVEFLYGRRIASMSADELTAVTEVSPEAFRGTEVTAVDFSASSIKDVSEYAFKETASLYSVVLPTTCLTISKGAFVDSKIAELKIPGSVGYIDSAAFVDPNGDDDIKDGIYEKLTDLSKLVFRCPDGSLAANVADKMGIAHTNVDDPVYATVIFTTSDGVELGRLHHHEVQLGEKVPEELVPEVPEKEGYVYVWNPDITTVVTEQIFTFTAIYEEEDPFIVRFLDFDDQELRVVKIPSTGGAVDPRDIPTIPEVEGYRLDPTNPGWICVWSSTPNTSDSPASLDNVTKSMDFKPNYIQYIPMATFYDDDKTTVIYGPYPVPYGGNVSMPPDPSKEGYIFDGWWPDPETDGVGVTEDVVFYAQYVKIDSMDTRYTVRFLDDDMVTELVKSQKVYPGEYVIVPAAPIKEGYVFDGWRPAAYLQEPITQNRDFVAMWKPVELESTPTPVPTPTPTPGGPTPTPTPTPGGATPTPTPGGATPTPTPGDATPTPEPVKFYTLTVQNGSGSGSYAAGAQPIVIANDPSATQEFDHWTIDPENTTIASKVLSATVVTMPEGNVTVTAHYRTKENTGTGGGAAPGSTNRPSSGTGTVSSGSTTVVIDKNGFSNTGVVSVVVNGSSDNFTIKISESSAATESVLRALMAEYGNVENIKYVPMDISLYDSTGSKRITDTTGLSIDITLPLPDSMRIYAGNNKVAGVVNDRLDKLTPKFTTINNVPCITFRAEHFSPYVIYVNTSSLGQGSEADNTPKTGDGIHPKWFLAIGLACLSFIMFMQKDGGTKKKRKVAVKAR